MGNCTGKLTALRPWTQSKEHSKLEDRILDQCATLNCLPFDFLRAITCDFSEEQELGRDQFGVVYKGVFQNGKVIAVKKLFEMHLSDEQFQKEVTDLYRLNHKNVVKLVGYGATSQWESAKIDGKYILAEVQKRVLCFEYINNKSLDNHISSMEPYGPGWHMRYEIICGICRGLNYLHMEGQIVHMHLKPQNILLDENMEPKIADFGMFRIFGSRHSQITTENGGATEYILSLCYNGYIAPEYLANGLVSAKTDIFSLGVIIIEVMTGRRDYPITEESYEHFVKQVVGCWRNGLEAGRYNPLEYYVEQVETCILMGLMCVNADPNKRPTARDILEKLTEADVMNMNKGPLRKQLIHLLRADAEIVGKGTYGTVYKATLENGTDVVVRRFKWETTKDEKDFKAEVAVLIKVQHPHLLAPIACFVERDEKLIVIDYMPKGSLSAFLHARDMSTPANWVTRMEIAKGIARGLTYLHDDMSIIHGNLTTRNVLLDEHSHAKVADFGLFRLLTPAANSKMLAAVSELVYYAPELCSPMNATTMTDVYSLGVIILELLTGKLPSSMGMPMWVVRDQWNRDMFDQELMQDEDAGPSLLDQLMGTLSLALACMNPSPSLRPQAREVIQELEHIHLSGDLEQSSSEWRQRLPADLFQETISMDSHSGSGLPRGIPFHLLEKITDGFSEERKLGSGAFGKVYMGVHKDGEKIAVKILYDMPGLDEEQFLNEFNNLSKLQHPNIVRLVGYCHETRKTCVEHNGRLVFAERIRMALCFEYMQFGSLDKHLSDEYNGLHWNIRYKLIKGICMGLKYLHEELRSPIYHLDLKPANILLDENMLPKIADFGLSRFFAEKHSQITRSSIGTLGYIPPEYIERNIISNKFDIFSLGVIIIKIVTGPTGYNRSAEMPPQEFVELAHKNWMKRLQVTPKHLLESYSKQVKKCVEIALSSVVADRHQRPSIGDIVEKLDDDTETDSQILTTSSQVME